MVRTLLFHSRGESSILFKSTYSLFFFIKAIILKIYFNMFTIILQRNSKLDCRISIGNFISIITDNDINVSTDNLNLGGNNGRISSRHFNINPSDNVITIPYNNTNLDCQISIINNQATPELADSNLVNIKRVSSKRVRNSRQTSFTHGTRGRINNAAGVGEKRARNQTNRLFTCSAGVRRKVCGAGRKRAFLTVVFIMDYTSNIHIVYI